LPQNKALSESGVIRRTVTIQRSPGKETQGAFMALVGQMTQRSRDLQDVLAKIGDLKDTLDLEGTSKSKDS